MSNTPTDQSNEESQLEIETFTKLRHNIIGDPSMGKSMLIFNDISFSLTSKPSLLRRFFDFFKCKRNPNRWYHYKTVIADYRKSIIKQQSNRNEEKCN